MKKIEISNMNQIQNTLPLPSPNAAPLSSEASDRSTISEIEQTYHININAIHPLDVASFPATPSVLNLLTTLPELYFRSRNFVEAIQNGDREGNKDAALSLAALPLSFSSSVVIAADYASIFGWLPHCVSTILKPLYAIGVLMCFIEGTIEGIGLSRCIRFSRPFDFKLVKSLHTLMGENSIAKKRRAVRSALVSIQNHREQMEQVYGKDQVTSFSHCFSDLERELKIEERQEEIKEIARMIVSRNLSYLRENYLGLSKGEVEEIKTNVSQKYLGKPPLVRQAALMRAFEKRVVNKYKRLARRIRPYLACEAIEKTNEVALSKLEISSPDHREQAIKEGLELLNDMRIQNEKKQLVHAMGIISLVFAAAFCVACIVGAPWMTLIILFSLAMIAGVGRALLFSGSLDVRGWRFSGKELLPHCLRRKMFPNALSLGDPKKLKAQIDIHPSNTASNESSL